MTDVTDSVHYSNKFEYFRYFWLDDGEPHLRVVKQNADDEYLDYIDNYNYTDVSEDICIWLDEMGLDIENMSEDDMVIYTMKWGKFPWIW